MGSCTSKTKKPSSKSFLPVHNTEQPVKLPIDVSEEYTFLVRISHIKLRGLPLGTYHLEIKWGEQEFTTAKLRGAEVKFQQEWSFQTKATIRFLQEEVIIVGVYQGNSLCAQTGISMWGVTVGPSYQNFALKSANRQILGRLGMDVQVLHVTQLEITALQLACEFTQDKGGRYSVDMVCAGTKHLQSSHSEVTEDPKWMFATESIEEDKPVKLLIDANLESLHKDSLQFRVWRHKKYDEEPILIGECWIGLSKLMRNERIYQLQKELSRSVMKKGASALSPSSFTLDQNGIMRKEDAHLSPKFIEKLWFCGRQIGQIKGEILLNNIPYITQLISGVNTEDGIQISSTNFMGSKRNITMDTQKMTLPEAIVSIEKIYQKLKEDVANKPGAAIQIRGADVRDHLEKITELIEKLRISDKETAVAHVYSGEAELIAAQNIYLDVGEHVLKYADTVAFELRNSYYDSLNLLIRRGEMDLGHMELSRTRDSPIHAVKLQTAARYRSFLRKILTLALGKLNLRGVDASIMNFTETTIALAYFRIPEFKDKLLACLKRKSFGVVEEWRNTQWDLETEVAISAEYLPMFDWHHFFYRLLEDSQDQRYTNTLNSEKWQVKLAKRGLAYFRLIIEWTVSVKRLFVHKHVPWQDIPGYSVILKSFLLELKARKVTEYPEVMLIASYALLHNNELLSVFLMIVFQKTNLYHFNEVMESYTIARSWLTFLHENNYTLPANFVSAFYITALKATISDEIALNIANSIWLLYETYHMYGRDVKEEVVLGMLLGAQRYRLMFHWSEMVRVLYWQFVLYRCKSMEWLSIVPLTDTDKDVISRANQTISFCEAVEVDISEKISVDMQPYIHLSRKKLHEMRLEYEDWKSKRRATMQTYGKVKGKYGVFDVLPYPGMTVDRGMEDEIEKRMTEEW